MERLDRGIDADSSGPLPSMVACLRVQTAASLLGSADKRCMTASTDGNFRNHTTAYPRLLTLCIRLRMGTRHQQCSFVYSTALQHEWRCQQRTLLSMLERQVVRNLVSYTRLLIPTGHASAR